MRHIITTYLMRFSLLLLASCGLIEPKKDKDPTPPTADELALAQQKKDYLKTCWEGFAEKMKLPTDRPYDEFLKLKNKQKDSLTEHSAFLDPNISQENKAELIEQMIAIKNRWQQNAFNKTQLSLDTASIIKEEETHSLYQVSYKRDRDSDHSYVGFVSVPKAVTDDTPILTYAHSGESGLAAAELARLNLSDSHIIVAPAFPGESCYLNSKQTSKGFEPQDASAILGTSAGEKSIWDQDADDLLALTYLVQQNEANRLPLNTIADRHIHLMGSSRGGLTALIAQLKMAVMPTEYLQNITKTLVLSSPLSPTTGSLRLALYDSIKGPLANSALFYETPLVHTLDQYAKPYRDSPNETTLNTFVQDVIARDYVLLLQGLFNLSCSDVEAPQRELILGALSQTHFIYHQNDQIVRHEENMGNQKKQGLLQTLKQQITRDRRVPNGYAPTLHTLKPSTDAKHDYHLDAAYFDKSQTDDGKTTLALIDSILNN